MALGVQCLRSPSDIRVAVYTGKGAGELGPVYDPQILERNGFIVEQIDETSLPDVISGFDVVFFPGGYDVAMSKGLGERGLRAIREFVAQGGGYFATCAGENPSYVANYHWK